MPLVVADEFIRASGFTEVELRRMMERARSLHRLPRRGRWVAETTHKGARWEVVVKPDPVTELLEVITAYPVKRHHKRK